MTLVSPSSTTVSSSADAPCLPSRQRPSSKYAIAFNRLIEAIAQSIEKHPDQHFSASLAGEDSQFTRFNSSKVRQSGQVCDGQLRLTLMTPHQTTAASLPFTGSFDADWPLTRQILEQLQSDLLELPEDPYVVLPEKAASEASHELGSGSGSGSGKSSEVRNGQLLSANAVAETLIAPVQSLDFSGLYAGGLSYRAYGDSAGKRHWFETPSFTLDYSLFGDRPQQAVKGTLAGNTWNAADYQRSIATAQQQLQLLSKPAIAIPKGAYRTYLAPAAVGDLIDTMTWSLGEAALRQGNSAFGKLEQGEAALSEKFSLSEDFQRIGVPRFNSSGAVAPQHLPIIQNGQWATSLVNARSAKEYNKPDNAANAAESMRAPVVAPGTLSEADILSRLGTGLYLSNLHYLNWSDLSAGRITGMTRYACFWVEEGEIVAPIENLRFDDNLYRFLGEGLIDLSAQQSFLPTVDTYDRRSLGGMWMPGMLIEQFRYTL
jgi:predicted Zn-dependent protease